VARTSVCARALASRASGGEDFINDMSAQWKGTGKGGACKVCKKICSCCATDSKDVHRANPVLCAPFCQELHSEEPGVVLLS
jgi:hypothetical protein